MYLTCGQVSPIHPARAVFRGARYSRYDVKRGTKPQYLSRLPEHPNFEDLKKQAKDLLRQYQANDPAAFHRFRESLPAAGGLDDAAIASLGLKLDDARSVIAREYGKPSWRNLRNYVDWRSSKLSSARQDAVPLWLHNVYGHDHDRPRPDLAAMALAERPDLGQGDLMLACATGDEAAVSAAIAADPARVHRLGNPWICAGCKLSLAMPPLVAVTHSTLLQLPQFRDKMQRCARLLLAAGADPNQSVEHNGHPLSALYGAAGKNHDADLTRLLLGAGANPNDGESLYHSMETRELECARLLLEAGAQVEGSNALHHQLDSDNLPGLLLLLQYTKDVNDRSSTIGSPLIWAIRRGRSRAHVEALLAAGADPHAKTKDGVSAYRFALESGLPEVADALASAGAAEELSWQDQFVAACARSDRAEALRIRAEHPDVFSQLSEIQLRQLPNLTEAGKHAAVRLMVELGWPIAVQGGDWKATALNLAVFQGNAGLARFLLEQGASWKEPHGFGDNVNGTLSWASRNQPTENGDWVACARALVEHGMPILELEGHYSDQVTAFLAQARDQLKSR